MKFGVVNKSTILNRFVLHKLQRNITHLAVITRKTKIKLGILKEGWTGKEPIILHGNSFFSQSSDKMWDFLLFWEGKYSLFRNLNKNCISNWFPAGLFLMFKPPNQLTFLLFLLFRNSQSGWCLNHRSSDWALALDSFPALHPLVKLRIKIVEKLCVLIFACDIYCNWITLPRSSAD